MTNKEAFIKSLDKIKADEIRDEETGEVLEKKCEFFPITFQYFLKSMTAVLVGCLEQMLKADYPDMTIGENKVSGKAPKEITAAHYMQVLIGDDLMRGMSLTLQLQGFLEWWLEQEADMENIEKMWYDYDSLAEKWNQYAEIRRKEV